jgi:hypothetical protein
MTLDAAEFIRRFLLHVLSAGFHRIRHYGLFAGTGRAHNIERVRQLFAAPTRRNRKLTFSHGRQSLSNRRACVRRSQNPPQRFVAFTFPANSPRRQRPEVPRALRPPPQNLHRSGPPNQPQPPRGFLLEEISSLVVFYKLALFQIFAYRAKQWCLASVAIMESSAQQPSTSGCLSQWRNAQHISRLRNIEAPDASALRFRPQFHPNSIPISPSLWCGSQVVTAVACGIIIPHT